ncbi:MAG: hypothetical protein KGS09_16135 [Nitrospirae bacterium]|nr:hypothetical protein [Nitrospirota bacterium]MBU6482065.1 hypothetical protein [Nitrospirota bacterium]
MQQTAKVNEQDCGKACHAPFNASAIFTSARGQSHGQFPSNSYPTYSLVLHLRVRQIELVGEGD